MDVTLSLFSLRFRTKPMRMEALSHQNHPNANMNKRAVNETITMAHTPNYWIGLLDGLLYYILHSTHSSHSPKSPWIVQNFRMKSLYINLMQWNRCQTFHIFFPHLQRVWMSMNVYVHRIENISNIFNFQCNSFEWFFFPHPNAKENIWNWKWFVFRIEFHENVTEQKYLLSITQYQIIVIGLVCAFWERHSIWKWKL